MTELNVLQMQPCAEQREFIGIVHHINHDSSVSRMEIKNKICHQYSSRNPDELAYDYDRDANIYISINGFTKFGRKAANAREIKCIYFDLDRHGEKNIKLSREFLDECVSNTENVLWDAINDDIIPEPTVITRTGRGLGLFYILDKSIAAASSANTSKQINFFKIIYRILGDKIKNILTPENNELASDPEALLLFDDKVVCDLARVTRLPGTYNQATKTKCSISHISKGQNNEIMYYSLSDLSVYCHFKPKKEKKAKVITYDFSGLNSSRIRQMEDLMMLRAGSGNGCRDYMCFVYYNSAVQIYGQAAAWKMLQIYNAKFTDPLTETEIRNIKKGIDTNKTKEYSGFYKLSQAWIVKNLNVTQDEYLSIDFRISTKELERARVKKERGEAKIKRNKAVLRDVLEQPSKSYNDIAKEHNISVRTLKNILKDANIRRYAEKKDTCAKSAKNCPLVCCVSNSAHTCPVGTLPQQPFTLSQASMDQDSNVLHPDFHRLE